MKKKKIFGDETFVFCKRIKAEKEKEENIWRKKIFYCGEEEKWRQRRRKIFGDV